MLASRAWRGSCAPDRPMRRVCACPRRGRCSTEQAMGQLPYDRGATCLHTGRHYHCACTLAGIHWLRSIGYTNPGAGAAGRVRAFSLRFTYPHHHILAAAHCHRRRYLPRRDPVGRCSGECASRQQHGCLGSAERPELGPRLVVVPHVPPPIDPNVAASDSAGKAT